MNRGWMMPSRRWRQLCLGSVASAALASAAMAAGPLPTNGKVVAGSATIANGAKSVTVNQSTSRAIIDWNSFSIGGGNSVFFNNGSGATLNKVTGGSLSQIDGLLQSTGSVFLINPSGVVVGRGGKVVTNGSFIGSTRDLSNSAFMAGGTYDFTGTSNGNVTNQGTITSTGGDVVLVGKSVNNSGSISAPQGTAALAAGDDVTLTPASGDQRISIAAGTGNVTNTGSVSAAAAELKAADGNVYALAGNSGVVRATGAQNIGGHIWLTSNGGDVQMTGNVAASNADGSGGTVTVRGASIEASGTIDTSATAAGKNGGTASIIATGTTTIAGTIRANGSDGAKGGFVETSGEHLHVAGSSKITTYAPDGITGTWLIDPTDFVIAASGGDDTGAHISSELNGNTNVDIESSNGSGGTDGNVIVNDPISWSTAAKLTLGAVNDIDINADITVSGGGALVMNTGGDYVIASGNSIFFTGGSSAGASLTINTQPYTLEYSVAQLATDIASNASGYYALADNYDAGPDGTYTSSPINTVFTGTFAGLGNTISNLTIDDTVTNDDVGLFAKIGNLGTVRDIGLLNASVTGTNSLNIGALVGYNEENVLNSYTTGTVTSLGSTSDDVGGLVGNNYGFIYQSYAQTNVLGASTNQGGLVGYNEVGGLTQQSYATGMVNDTLAGAHVGGLAGENDGGFVEDYALGSVTGGSAAFIGGLVGVNSTTGAIQQTYSIGAVTGGSGAVVGGLVGGNDNVSNTSIQDSYFDTETSGTQTGIAGGNGDTVDGVTGDTTYDLQSRGLAGFDFVNTWGYGTELFPYFLWQYPDEPLAISGTAYGNGGVLPASGQVSFLVDGAALPQASIGANGYYYSLLPNSVVASAAILAYTAGAEAGARLDVADNAFDGDAISQFDIWGSTLIAPTSATTYSAASATSLQSQNAALIAQAVGSNADPTSGLNNYGYIATNAFDIDGHPTFTNGLYVFSEAAPSGPFGPATIVVTGQILLPGSAALELDGASVEFANNVTVSAGGAVRLNTYQHSKFSAANETFDAGDSLSFTGGPASGATLTVDGVPFTLIYNMTQLQALNDPANSYAALTGNYALATSLDASLVSNYVPIGVDSSGIPLGCGCGFDGYMDGLGHTISNLTINRPNVQNVGLFGDVGYYGIITDLGVVGGSFAGQGYVGALAGYSDGVLSNDWSTANVTSKGTNFNGDYAGGLVGYADLDSEIDNSYAAGTVTGAHEAVGGFAGYNAGIIEETFASGSVSGSGYVGGLVGVNDGGLIAQSYATGAVAASGNVAGGLVGYNTDDGGILASYALGAVRGASDVGGLVGKNDDDSGIEVSYSIGAVSGSSSVGGLVGYNGSTGTVAVSDWDTETSGTTTAIGTDRGGQSANITANTTAQLMNSPADFTGLPFWETGPGLLPYLDWQSPNGTPTAITGYAYNATGTSVLASDGSGAVTVAALAEGSQIGTDTTGANGFYYIFVPSGTFTGTQQQVVYLKGDADKANNFSLGTAANVTVNLYANTLQVDTGESTASGMFDDMYMALYGNSSNDFLYNGSTIVSGTTFDIDAHHSGGFDIDVPIDVGTGSLRLNSTGAVAQSAPLTAASLDLEGTATYVLTNSANAIGTLAADTGAISFANNTDLTVGTVNGTAGVTSTGAVTLAAAGNLTVASGAAVTAGSGDNAVLSATGNFVNDDGSGAVSVSGGGRWLIYSAGPSGDTFGNLNSANTAVWDATYATLAPGSVTQNGNRYLFAYAPHLTVTTTNVSKEYGENGTASVAAAYTITGLQSGVTGAFLGDTAAVYSGTPAVTSSGSAKTASVAGGPYAINASAGSLTAANGYSIVFDNAGELTVTARPITITADDLSRIYGNANPALTYTIGGDGLVNGDILTGALTTTASATGNVGGYAITQGTLTGSSNYDVTYTPGTLTVTTRPITITANDLSKVYGTSDPTLTYTIGGDGLVNGDTLTGSLTRAAGETVAGGPYAIGQGSLAADSNYAVTFTGGEFTITPAMLTASLIGLIEKTYDGTTAAATTAGNYSLSGLVGSDSVSIEPGAAAYAGKNVGSGIEVTANGLTLTGADASNYVLASTTVSAAIGKIDPAMLTITANDLSATSITSVTPTVTYSGFVPGEGPSLVSGLSFVIGPTNSPTTFFILPHGATAPNYDITFVAGSLRLGSLESVFEVPGISAEIWDLTPSNWQGQLPGYDLLPIILDTSTNGDESPQLLTTEDNDGNEYVFTSGSLTPRFDINFTALLSSPDTAPNLGTASP